MEKFLGLLTGITLSIAFSLCVNGNEHSATPDRSLIIDSTPSKPDSANRANETFVLMGSRQQFMYLLYVLRQPEPAYKDVIQVTDWIEKNVRVANVDTTKKKNP